MVDKDVSSSNLNKSTSESRSKTMKIELFGKCLASIWQVSGQALTNIWDEFGKHMASVSQSFGIYLASIGKNLVVIWPLFGK